MTADDFRRLALSLPEAEERSHMGHPDFRVRGKIFATLGYPEGDWAMVKLTPQQQTEFMLADPAIFTPVKGGWGRHGCTNVLLEFANPQSVKNALLTAWRNTAPKRLAEGPDSGSATASAARRRTRGAPRN